MIFLARFKNMRFLWKLSLMGEKSSDGIKMVNQSKKNDPRFWAKWRASGSVGNVEIALRDAKRRESDLRYRSLLETSGNLSPKEVDRLVGYEIYRAPRTIRGQIRRYYLRTKAENPEKAETMIRGLALHMRKEPDSEQGVMELCTELSKYQHSFIIIFGEQSFYPSGSEVYYKT